MAQTVTKVTSADAEGYASRKVGGIQTSVGTCVGPASYSTGGFDLTTSSFITGTIYNVVAQADGYTCSWDQTNAKVKVYWSKGSAGAHPEITATTNLSGVTFTLLITHV